MKMIRKEEIPLTEEQLKEQERKEKLNKIHLKENDMDFQDSSPLSPYLDKIKQKNIKKERLLQPLDIEAMKAK